MKPYIFALLILLSSGTISPAQVPVTKLEAAQYSKKVAGKNVQLIDIRTPSEYASGHIQGAQNIDFYSSTFATDMDKFIKSKPLYIYCRSGNRSSLATDQLINMGYTQIFDLKSGIVGWQNSNLPLEK